MEQKAWEEIVRKKREDQANERAERAKDKQETKQAIERTSYPSSPKTWKERIIRKFVRSPEQQAQKEREETAYNEAYYKAKIKHMRKKGRKDAIAKVWKKKHGWLGNVGRNIGHIDTYKFINPSMGGYGGMGKSSYFGNDAWDLLGMKTSKPKKKHHKGRRLVIRY